MPDDETVESAVTTDTTTPPQGDVDGLDHNSLNAQIADNLESSDVDVTDDGDVDSAAAPSAPAATDPAAPLTFTPEQLKALVSEAAANAVQQYQAANPAKAAEPTDSDLGIRSVAEIEAELVEMGVDAETAKKNAGKTYEREKAQAKQLHAIASERTAKAQAESQQRFVSDVHSSLGALPEAETYYGKEGSRTQEQSGARAMATQLTDLIMEGAKARGLAGAKLADAIAIAHFGVIGTIKAQKSGKPATTATKPRQRVEAQQRPPQLRTFKTEDDLNASKINKEIAQFVEA